MFGRHHTPPAEPAPRRVGFPVTVRGPHPAELERLALGAAARFFGPGAVLEITDNYLVTDLPANGRDYRYAAEITVWSARVPGPAAPCPECGVSIETDEHAKVLPHVRAAGYGDPGDTDRCWGRAPGERGRPAG